jgi:hypothetical protein
MKKIYWQICLLFSLSLNINAQDNQIIGSWLINKVNMENQDQEIYFPIDFSENGEMAINDVPFGMWKYDQKNQKLNISSANFQELDGENSILKLNNEELTLEKNGTKVFFIKIEREKIYDENKNSGLIGIWEIKDEDNPGSTKHIMFESPDKATLIIKEEGVDERQRSQWIYNEKDETLIILSRLEILRGLSKLIKLDNENIELENNGIVYSLVRQEQSDNRIERLTFSEDEFYDEDGNWKYEEDDQKLPWQDFYDMMTSLENIHQLVYNYGKLIEDTEVFENKTLTANVRVDNDQETFSIDYIFNGYDSFDLPEDTQLPTSIYSPSSYPSVLYPLGDAMPFRVIGKEEITTPAGTFNCTVIEALGDFEAKMKMWMINDKPCIYARIINDRPGSFGHYFMYELQEIN